MSEIYFENIKQESDLEVNFTPKHDPNTQSEIVKEEFAICKTEETVEDDTVLHDGEFIETVPQKQIIKCEKCEFSTTKSCYLNRHVLRIHKNHLKEKSFKCDLCEKSYVNLNGLKIHMVKHSGERSFTCDKCVYKTNCKWSLTKHKIIHSEEKPFKCDLCDYETYFNSSLIGHKRTHSDEKPFRCNSCDYKTHSKRYLISHNLFHSEEKQFKCKLCDFRYKYPRNLRIHMLKHSGEKQQVRLLQN